MNGVVLDPASGQQIVVASLEKQRVGVEKDVKSACSEFLNEPDWDKNMSIVDQLNRAPYLCPFVIKAIRMQLKTKNPEIEILALQLTETIIKNCPSSHAAVAQEEFMRYLVKVGTDQRAGGKWTQLKSKMKKNKNVSKHVRSQCIEKALLILKMLSIAYMDSGLYPVFRATFKQLESQNIRFPETNKDESLNVFTPMHSTAAQDEFAQSTAMGSVQNVHLEMIRPFVPVENVTNSELKQAQESAQLLWTMINAPVLSYELIPDLTEMLSNSQQLIVVMISEGNASENTLVEAFAVNDVVNQVLEDAQCIANGTKRRYQQEVNVKNLMKKQDSDGDKDENEKKDPNDDEEVSLEHSISLEVEDNSALFALTAPNSSNKVTKKRLSKKANRQSIDLLGMNDNTQKQQQQTTNGNTTTKKPESEENILDFLGVSTEKQLEKNTKPVQQKATIFDPLQDENDTIFTQPQAQKQHIQNNNTQQQQPPILSNISKGNQSVLDVLTGQSTQKQSVQIVQTNTNKPKKKDSFDIGTDPFADMITTTTTTTTKEERKEEKIQNNDNDPFADIGGSAFDDPIMSAPPKKEQKEAMIEPPLKKQNSDNIILDMFASGAPPDPNMKKKKEEKQSQKDESNPFGDDNPFGVNDNNDDSNPFDALSDPFSTQSTEDVKVNESNPFEALDDPFASNDNIKSEEFMADRDPFAGM